MSDATDRAKYLLSTLARESAVAFSSVRGVLNDCIAEIDRLAKHVRGADGAFDGAQKRIELLEAAMIETDNGKIRCLVCKRETYAREEILHKKDCLLFATHPAWPER